MPYPGSLVLEIQDPNNKVVSVDFIVEDVIMKVESVEGITKANVNIVFDPPWDKDMMSEEAQLELGFL